MKNVIITGGALVVALIGSYYTWSHPDDGKDDATKVPMFRASEGEVTKIVYTADDATITLERRHDDHGDYTWVTTHEEVAKAVPPKPAGDTDVAATPEPPPEKVITETAFLGNDAAEKLWKTFSPVMALRELAADGNFDPKTFGLDAPKGTLTVDKGGAPLAMQIGGETWGARDRYVQLDNKVFLVDDQDLRPLQYGKTRLVERGVQPLAEADLDTATVTQGATTVGFTQQHREDRQAAYWARDSAPDQKDEVGATWLDKMLKVRVQAFPAAADVPANLTPVFSYTVSGHKDGTAATWTVDILRDDAAKPPEFYAKSAFDRSTVKLTRTLAAEVVDELGAALSGTAPAADPRVDDPGDHAEMPSTPLTAPRAPMHPPVPPGHPPGAMVPPPGGQP